MVRLVRKFSPQAIVFTLQLGLFLSVSASPVYATDSGADAPATMNTPLAPDQADTGQPSAQSAAATDAPITEDAADVPDAADTEPAAAQSATADDPLEKGKALYRASKFDEAEAVFNDIKAADPKDAQPYYWLGQIAIKKGDIDKGLGLIEQSVNMANDNPLLWFALADAYAKNGRAEKAKAAYEKSLAIKPDLYGARFGLGQYYIDKRNWNAGIEQLEKVISELKSGPLIARARATLQKIYPRWQKELVAQHAAHEKLPVELMIDRGQVLQLRGENKLALDLLDLALKQAPKNPRALFWSGKALLQLGQNDQALTNIKLSSDLEPDNAVLKLHLAETYEAVGKIDSAIDLYGELAESKKMNERTRNEARKRWWRLRASSADQAGNYAKAITLYHQLIGFAGPDATVYEALAEVYDHAGDFEKAEIFYQKAIEESPADFNYKLRLLEAYQSRGDVMKLNDYTKQLLAQEDQPLRRNAILERAGLDKVVELIDKGSYDDALAQLERLKELAPDEPVLIFNTGVVFYKQGKLDKAKAEFLHAMNIAPYMLDASNNYASILVSQGQLAEGVKYYEKVLDSGLENPAVDVAKSALKNLSKKIIELGRTLLTNGDLAAADEVFSKLIEREPDNAQGHYWLGQVNIKRKDFEKGIVDLDRSVRLAPDNIKLREALAKAYVDAGLNDKAIETLNKALAITPDNRDVLLELADVYLKQDNKEEAGKALKEVVGNGVDVELTSKVLDRLDYSKGIAMLEQKQFDDALAVFEAIDQVVPDVLVVWVGMARAYYGMGKEDQAEEYFRKALEKNPGNVEAGLGLAQLLTDQGRVDEAIDAYTHLNKAELGGREEDVKAALALLYSQKAQDLAKAIIETPEGELDVAKAVNTGKELVLLKVKESVQVFSALSRYAADNAQIYYWWGRALTLNGDYKEAISKVKKSTELMPDNTALQTELAKLYAIAGNIDQAIKMFRQFKERNPEDLSTRLLLAKYYQETDKEAMQAELKEIVLMDRNGPGGKKALEMLGYDDAISAALKGDYALAIDKLEEIVQLIGEDAPILDRIAEYYHSSGDDDNAVAYYERSLAVDEKNTHARIALAEILSSGSEQKAMEVLEPVYGYEKDSEKLQPVDTMLSGIYKRQTPVMVAAVEHATPDQSVLFDRAVFRAARMFKLAIYGQSRDVLTAVLKKQPEDSQANYWLGQIYVHDGEYGPGISYLKKSVAGDPQNIGLKMELASVYEESGDLDAAEAILVPLVGKVKSAGQSLHVVRAKQYVKKGDIDKAAGEYKKNLIGKAADADVWMEIGGLYERSDRHDDADTAYGKALDLKPDDVDLLISLADIYEKRGDIDKAIDYLVRVVRSSPPDDIRHETALSRLGLARIVQLTESNEYVAAAKGVAQLLEKFPDDPVLIREKGYIVYKLGYVKEAQKWYTQALSHNANDADLYLKMGYMFIKLNRIDDAVTMLERAAKLGKGREAFSLARGKDIEAFSLATLNELYVRRAEVMRKNGKIDQAISDYRRILENEPGRLEVRMALAVTLRVTKQYDEALVEFNKIKKASPFNVQVYLNLAAIYEAQRDLDNAVDSYAYLAMLETDEAKQKDIVNQLRITLVQKYMQIKDYVAAYRELDDFRRDSPDFLPTYRFLASLYARAEEREKAAEAYEKIIQINPDDLRIRFALGVLYEQMSEYDLASDQYRAIISSDKKDITVGRARDRYDNLQDRLALFRSRMEYRLNTTESTVPGSTSYAFGSRLQFTIDANARPAKNATIGVNLGSGYNSDHKLGSDSLSPSLRVNGTLNYDNLLFNGSIGQTETHGLLLETMSGTTTSANLSGTLRFKQFFGFLNKEEKLEVNLDNSGVTDLSRAELQVAPEEKQVLEFTQAKDANNSTLKAILESMQGREPEEIKSHTVVPGDTLWDIAEELLDDPWLWPELWYANPNIENPHLIYPGDKISLLYIEGVPKLILQRAGAEFKTAPITVEDGMAMYAKGLKLYNEGKLEEALKTFQDLLKFVPDDPLTNYYAGLIYLTMDRFPEAEAAFRLVLGFNPQSLRARVKLAEALELQHKFSEAIKELELALQYAAGTPYTGFIEDRIARVYRSRAFAAIDELSVAGGMNDENIKAAMDFSAALYERKDIDGAVAAFERIQKLLPERADVDYWLGRIYLESGRLDKGVELLRTAVSLTEANPEYLFELAKASELAGDPQAAETYYSLVVENATASQQLVDAARLRLGKLRASGMMAVGNYSGAVDEYSALLNIFPDNVDILLLTARANVALGDVLTAEPLFERVVALAPDNVPARLGLLRLRLRDGEYETLAEDIQAILKLDNGDETRFELLMLIGLDEGVALINAGKFDQARDKFNHMLLLMPDDPVLLINLAVIYQVEDDYGEAESLLTRVVNDDPLNLTARLRLGMLLAASGRHNDAIIQFEKILELGGDLDIEAEAKKWVAKLRQFDERAFVNLDEEEPVPKSLSLSGNYRKFDSTELDLFATKSYGGSLLFTYPTGAWGTWNLSYGMNITKNIFVLGRDYANVTQQYSLSVSRPIYPSKIRGLFGVVGYTAANALYDDLDSNAFYRLSQSERRSNKQDSFALTLIYRLHDKLRFTLSANKFIQKSNLPTGFIYDTARGVPVAYQSASLGDYTSTDYSLSMRFDF